VILAGGGCWSGLGRPQHFLYLLADPHQQGALRAGGQLIALPAAMMSFMQASPVFECAGSRPVRVVLRATGGTSDGEGAGFMASTKDWFETIAEAQRRAKRRLPRSVYLALVAGTDQGITLRTTSPPTVSSASVRTSPTCRGPASRPPRSWDRTSPSRC
jgi:hypothetical protein